MPGGNGTGPMGAGSMTGKRMGPCALSGAWKCGAGLGLGFGPGFACRHGLRRSSGRGVGHGFHGNPASDKMKKEVLRDQRDALKQRLDFIDKQLENL